MLKEEHNTRARERSCVNSILKHTLAFAQEISLKPPFFARAFDANLRKSITILGRRGPERQK